MKKVIVTGGAGFIGSHLVDALLQDSEFHVTCIDNFDSFYNDSLKRKNIENHLKHNNYRLIEADICDFEFLIKELDDNYELIIHLAAKAGVRPSLENPIEYQRVNVLGTQSMLEIARNKGVGKFIFASSSSVYGINKQFPWNEDILELKPISPYATSKIAGEWMGKCYSEIYKMQFVALRFFTVFGPRQRPDLAINKFVSLIQKNEPISLFGDGSTMRDYTFVNDIIKGIQAAMLYQDKRYEVFNLGNSYPIKLSEMINTIESVLQKNANINYLPEQVGDVPATLADISKAQNLLGYIPTTSFKEGIEQFIAWKANQG